MRKRILSTFLTVLIAISIVITGVGCNIKPEKFTVTFSGGAEDAVLYSGEEIQIVQSADQIIEPIFVRPGYNFVGWNANISRIDKTTTVKALWSVYEFSVTFEGNGGKDSSGNAFVTDSFKSGLDLKERAPLFVKEGYDLSWDKDLATITESCVVNAIWTPKQYKISFLDADGTDLGVEDITVLYDQPVSNLPTLPSKQIDDKTIQLVRWEIKSENQDEFNVPFYKGTLWNRTEDLTLYARWSEDDFVIDYNLAGGTMGDNPHSYSAGDPNIAIQAPTKVGYDFAGWIGTDISEPTMNLVISSGETGDKQLIATWTPKTYTFTLDADGGNMASGNKINIVYDAEVGTLPIPERDGYHFVGWRHEYSGMLVVEGQIWNTKPEGLVFKAIYKRIYTISFSLTSIVRKTNIVPCTLKSANDLSGVYNDDELLEYTIQIVEDQTLKDLGIQSLPTVDPIEPKNVDEYSYSGYWKMYDSVLNKSYRMNPDTPVNDKNFPGMRESGQIVLIPHCKAHWTRPYSAN